MELFRLQNHRPAEIAALANLRQEILPLNVLRVFRVDILQFLVTLVLAFLVILDSLLYSNQVPPAASPVRPAFFVQIVRVLILEFRAVYLNIAHPLHLILFRFLPELSVLVALIRLILLAALIFLLVHSVQVAQTASQRSALPVHSLI